MNNRNQRFERTYLKSGLLVVLALIAAFFLFVFLVRAGIENFIYPRKYQIEVEDISAKYGMEPNLVYAIIKAESGFSETAVSSAGALGLMQVLPEAFLMDIRGNVSLAEASSDVLFKPYENILSGTYYFTHWYDYFYDVYGYVDPTVEALAAYNAGISRVWEWLDDNTRSDENGLIVDEIPLKETRNYVKRVLRYKEKYDALYGKAVMSNGYVSEALCYRWAKHYGEVFGVDAHFVLSIIRAESTFKPSERSGSGAAGLMQIIESTYEDIRSDLSLSEDYDMLFEDPEFNVKCGVYYLHWVNEQGLSGIAQIAAGYNAGAVTVLRWLSDPDYSHDGKYLIVENIPYDQTRRYVSYVLDYYEEYLAKYRH